MSSILAERELYVDQNEIYRDYISRFEINYNVPRSETPAQWTSAITVHMLGGLEPLQRLLHDPSDGRGMKRLNQVWCVTFFEKRLGLWTQRVARQENEAR